MGIQHYSQSGGGRGTVKSVNNILPDEEGNVVVGFKKTVFVQETNPVLDGIGVEDGNVWIFTGDPVVKYDRINGNWVSLTEGGGTFFEPSILNAEKINFSFNQKSPKLQFNGNRNYIIKSKIN